MQPENTSKRLDGNKEGGNTHSYDACSNCYSLKTFSHIPETCTLVVDHQCAHVYASSELSLARIPFDKTVRTPSVIKHNADSRTDVTKAHGDGCGEKGDRRGMGKWGAGK